MLVLLEQLLRVLRLLHHSLRVVDDFPLMVQNEDLWIDFIGYLTRLAIDARNLFVNLAYQVFDFLCSHVVFILNRLLFQSLQLQDAIALFGNHVLC